MWMPKLKDMRLVNRECVCGGGGGGVGSSIVVLAYHLLNIY